MTAEARDLRKRHRSRSTPATSSGTLSRRLDSLSAPDGSRLGVMRGPHKFT